MPITYQIDPDRRLVVATPHGKLTDADIFGYQREVWGRPDTAGFDELIDMTGVSEVEFVSSERVAELAELSGSMDAPATVSKLAVIAESDLHFGLGRMYQTFRELHTKGTKKVEIFRTRREATEWLGGAAIVEEA